MEVTAESEGTAEMVAPRTRRNIASMHGYMLAEPGYRNLDAGRLASDTRALIDGYAGARALKEATR